MSDSRFSPRSPFAPLRVSYGEPVGSHGSPNLGSRPVDHRSQVLCRSQRSPKCNGAQHTCGPPHLSLLGFGLPRTTSEVFDTSHRDGVQTIQRRGPGRGCGRAGRRTQGGRTTPKELEGDHYTIGKETFQGFRNHPQKNPGSSQRA
jgi:hypothetical protein